MVISSAFVENHITGWPAWDLVDSRKPPEERHVSGEFTSLDSPAADRLCVQTCP